MKNMIFDMGNVLIRFEPERFVERERNLSAQEREALLNGVFRAPEWWQMDSGELDEAAFEAIVRARLPERLHAAAHRMIWAWDQPILPIDGMAELARECKSRGMGVYLLSNASARQPAYWPNIPGHEVFDGAVISALERCVKPAPPIYHILLDRFGLNPADCLFTDDSPANVAGAIAAGMSAVRFDGNAGALRQAVARFAGW